MASKYDLFWMARLGQIRDGIRLACARGHATIPLSGLRSEGDRQTWHGNADVRGSRVVRTSMAHATSLARVVASSGICEQWPERTIRLTISAAGDKLTISATTGPATILSGDPRATSPGDRASVADVTHRATSRDRQAQTDEFYALLDELARNIGGPRLLRHCTGDSGWPSHGVYFFYENGELRQVGSPRVVRIGTHALTETSQASLWGRLRQHRGQTGGRHAGGGNHRASVFRRHVGAAIIRREGVGQDLLDSWLDRHNRGVEMARREAQIEVKVSQYIGDMPFLWLAVPERSDRDCIERNSIALLSCRVGGLDIPSADWLGGDAEREEIRDSGLWNVNHVGFQYNPVFLEALARLSSHSH